MSRLTINVDAVPSLFEGLSERVSLLDFTSEMLAALELIQDGERAAFDGGFNPSTGEQWQPNAPSTIAKKGHGIPLFVTGALEESLVDEKAPFGIREAEARGLLFGTEIPYSLFNQEGTTRAPARPHVGMREELVDLIAEEVLESAIEQLRG